MQGGVVPTDPRYEVNLRTQTVKSSVAPMTSVRTDSAGKVTIISSYEIIDLQNNHKTISQGRRLVQASYDRTGQSFANSRALRDAENRAAKELAESLRLAIYTDINRQAR